MPSPSLPLLVHGTQSTDADAAVTLKYQWPIQTKYRISTHFGDIDKMHPKNTSKGCVNRGHGGIDIAVPEGTEVHAARDGKVLNSGVVNGYGHWVVLAHDDGEISIYGHVGPKGLPKVGAKVKAGNVIAKVGSKEEGNTSGPHLHFQINVLSSGYGACTALDPLKKTSQ
jgi:murein DD-endopeptidase MepM/ murein hydrolase activator NlpD